VPTRDKRFCLICSRLRWVGVSEHQLLPKLVDTTFLPVKLSQKDSKECKIYRELCCTFAYSCIYFELIFNPNRFHNRDKSIRVCYRGPTSLKLNRLGSNRKLISSEQSVAANYPPLCMLVKVLQPLQPKLICRPAVLRHRNKPVLRQILLLVPGREVMAALEDDEGWDSPPCPVDALDNCSPLSIALLHHL